VVPGMYKLLRIGQAVATYMKPLTILTVGLL
jgi:hypothetical protein